MNNNDVKRITRLTSIVTQLQTKRLITATQLANHFNVSVRTIYRDIRTLEQSGIPILTEEGKGYSLMAGYKMPPIAFTDFEFNALVVAEQLVIKSGDTSLINDYIEAMAKIKAIAKLSVKYKMELLANRIAISPAFELSPSSNYLALIQHALTSFTVIELNYQSISDNKIAQRRVEPFALYYSLQEKWLLIAYCRLREDFRMFRIDRILQLRLLDTYFKPHELTLEKYLQEKRNQFLPPDIPLSSY